MNDEAQGAAVASMNRRHVLMAGAAATVVRLAGAGAGAALAGTAQAAEGQRPNVLFILAGRSRLEGRRFPRLRHQDAEPRQACRDRRKTGAVLFPAHVHPDARRLHDGALSASLRPADCRDPSAGKYGLATDEWLLPRR